MPHCLKETHSGMTIKPTAKRKVFLKIRSLQIILKNNLPTWLSTRARKAVCDDTQWEHSRNVLRTVRLSLLLSDGSVSTQTDGVGAGLSPQGEICLQKWVVRGPGAEL